MMCKIQISERIGRKQGQKSINIIIHEGKKSRCMSVRGIDFDKVAQQILFFYKTLEFLTEQNPKADFYEMHFILKNEVK